MTREWKPPGPAGRADSGRRGRWAGVPDPGRGRTNRAAPLASVRQVQNTKSRHGGVIQADHGVPPSDATGSSSSSQAFVVSVRCGISEADLGKRTWGKRGWAAGVGLGETRVPPSMSWAAGLVRSERSGLCMHGG